MPPIASLMKSARKVLRDQNKSLSRGHGQREGGGKSSNGASSGERSAEGSSEASMSSDEDVQSEDGSVAFSGEDHRSGGNDENGNGENGSGKAPSKASDESGGEASDGCGGEDDHFVELVPHESAKMKEAPTSTDLIGSEMAAMSKKRLHAPSPGSNGGGNAIADAVPPVTGPPEYKARAKPRRVTLRRDMEEVARAAKAKGIRTELSALPVEAVDTFEDFHEAMAHYCAENFTMYAIRSSNGQEAWNTKLTLKHEKKWQKGAAKRKLLKAQGKEVPEEPPLHLIPSHLKYYQREYHCVHGDYQKAKGGLQVEPSSASDHVGGSKVGGSTAPQQAPKQIRYQASTLYTGCEARVTAIAVRGSDGKWQVKKKHENAVHNHSCNRAVFESYQTDSFIDDSVMFKQVADQIAVNGDPRLMRDRISAARGGPYSRSKFSNLKHCHLGGGEVKENLERLMDLLIDTEDGRCLLVHDQENTVTGILFQTGIQREYVRRFGDNLILDWTHGTNNVGFHLGTLMATSVTGKGFPVFNFLCLSRGVKMMTTVLQQFLEGSPDAVLHLESIVIDKDYKEWKALKAVFKDSVRLMRVKHTDIYALQATRPIPSGVVIGEYLGFLSLQPQDKNRRAANEGFRLHFHADRGVWGTQLLCVDARLGGSLMRFLNHSCSPSARFYEMNNAGGRLIVATTCREIATGEEITVDYGDDLWFDCKCEVCVKRCKKRKRDS